MNYKQLLVVAVLVVLPLLLNGNVSVHQDIQGWTDPLRQMATELLDTLNWERELNDLPALQSEPLLCQAAAAHNEKMLKEQRLAHEFPDYPTLFKRLEAQGLLFVEFCGENIARSDSNSIEQVHETLMASPLHMANILTWRSQNQKRMKKFCKVSEKVIKSWDVNHREICQENPWSHLMLRPNHPDWNNTDPLLQSRDEQLSVLEGDSDI